MHWELRMCKVLWQKLKLKWEQKNHNLNLISALKMHTVKEKRHVNRSILLSVWGVLWKSLYGVAGACTQEWRTPQAGEGSGKVPLRQETGNESWKMNTFPHVCVGSGGGGYCTSERKRCKNYSCMAEGLAERGKWFPQTITDSAQSITDSAGVHSAGVLFIYYLFIYLGSFKLPEADFKIVLIYTGQKSGAEEACLHLIPKPRHSKQFHLHRDLFC